MKQRILRFYAVGSAGIAVQLSVLAFLTSCLHLNYLVATALAVEIAVIHNFAWHDRWTWPGGPAYNRLLRFGRFHLSTGAISIVGNVLITGILVAITGMPYLPANLVAIAAASVANFLAGEWYVFSAER
jgi:putative flippase GtrA